MPTDDEILYMKRACRLALRGTGRVSPNPLVGAVVVRNGVVVGEGYHLYERKDHAEVIALAQAGSKAKGADLYVNLEPCSHVGRTPPCVDSIIRAGVRRVFVAIRDPNHLVSGQGIAALRKQGIEVREGVCREEASRLNEKFLHFIQTRRPFVLLKLGMTLDGRIAAASGQSRWITGEQSRRVAHNLRFEYDAVLVGVNTVVADDPSLDTRGARRKPLTKVILDSELRTPQTARVFKSPGPVVIFFGPGASESHAPALRQAATLIPVTKTSDGLDWDCILRALGEQGVTSVLIEGGGRVAASAIRAGVVQKIAFFYAPKILGAEGISGIGRLGVRDLSDALQLADMRVKRLGSDFLVEGYPITALRPARFPA